MSRRCREITAVCLLLAIIAGCGKSADKTAAKPAEPPPPKLVPVDQWAGEVCTALQQYQAGAPDPAGLDTRLDTALRLADARVEAATFYRNYAQRADRLVIELEASDIPDVPGGAEGREVFNSYFIRASDALAAVQNQLDKITPTDPSTFHDRVRAIVSESGTAFSTDDLEKFAAVNAPMYEAFSTHPNCEGLLYGILP